MSMIDRLGGVLNQQNAGGGTTVYAYEDFTLTTTGDLSSGGNLTVDELGNGWQGTTDATTWQYQSDSSGICGTVVSAGRTQVVQTNGREDVQCVLDLGVLNLGLTAASDRWQGMVVRATSGSGGANVGLLILFSGASSGPDLKMWDGSTGGTLLKTWDLSALLTTQPSDGDAVVLTFRCSGNNITFYSIQVNGGSVETPDDTYTLTGTPATDHGSGSGADYYGIACVEDRGEEGNRFKSFTVESLP